MFDPGPPPRPVSRESRRVLSHVFLLGFIFSSVLVMIGLLGFAGFASEGKYLGGTLFLGMFGLFGGIPIVRGVRRLREIVSILRTGQCVQGKIEAVRPNTNRTFNKQPTWDVVYSYELGEKAYEARFNVRHGAPWEEVKQRPLSILYDSADPRRHVIFPLDADALM